MNDATALPRFGPLPEDLATLRLPANALLLLDKLRFFYCRGGRRFCWPSDAELSRRTGLSIHQVRRALRRLEQEGLIQRQTTTRRLDHARIRRRRFIDLCFDEPGAGAQHHRAPALTARCAPVRNQEVVSVERSQESETSDPDQRERRPHKAPSVSPASRQAEANSLPQTLTAIETPTSEDLAAQAPGPSPARSTEEPTPDPLGEAMARVFGRLGATLPTLTPNVDPPGLQRPEGSTPVSRPSSGSRPRGRLRSFSIEELEYLATGGDRVLQDELARRRHAERRRSEAATVPPPATTSELLLRLREDPSYVSLATQGLALELDDQRSWRGLHALCKRAFEGGLDPRALVHAFEKARGPNVRRPGAIFTIEVARWRPR